MVSIARPPRTDKGTLVSPIGEGDLPPMAPNARPRTVGPFAVLGHFDSTFAPGEAPRDLDVRPHPHIGIATLSYLFAGAVTHRDGLGNDVEIRAGDVAWMVTGRGVVHSERFTTVRERGGRLHGLQIWVALSGREEECEPSFELVPSASVLVTESAGVRVRQLLGGEARRPCAPEAAFGPLWLSDIEIARGAAYTAPAGKQGALYVIEGTLEIGGLTVSVGQTASFGESESDDDRRFVASEPVRAICFGGDPIGPRHLWWNFLHSSKESLERAKVTWREKGFALPPDDRDEFIPLPADEERPLIVLNAP